MTATPRNLIQLIDKAEEVFGKEFASSGVLLSDIPEFYQYLGIQKVIRWLKAIKKELEDEVYPQNSP